MTGKSRLVILCALGLLLSSSAHAALPKDVACKAKVLVRDFTSVGVRADRGQLAAEVVAAALEAGGLADALRPTYVEYYEWHVPPDNIKLDDVSKDADGKWTTENVDVYTMPQMRRVRREFTSPDSEFLVEGSVARIGKLWWVKATLYERVLKRKLSTAAASAEADQGFLDAAKQVAAKVAQACRSQVLTRQSQAVLRAFKATLWTRQEAFKRLEEMHKRWPDAFAPVAMLLRVSLETGDKKKSLAWAEKTAAALPTAGPAGRRFILVLGVNPYQLLAGHYESQGKLQEAAAAHRQAATSYPGPRFPHWMAVARLEMALGHDAKALAAYNAALKITPSDADANRLSALLLKKLGRKADAAKRFKVFLKHHPNSPHAQQVREVLKSFTPE